MLLQLGSDEKWHLVYCASKKTTETENKYHSSKLELMAIVWTLERLRQFLLGISFTVVTDCQALIYMNVKKSSNPQIARWSLLIQEFDFEIRHRPGVRMSHIDAISRAPVLNSSDTLDSLIENKLEVCLTLSVEDQVLMMQHADDTLKELILILEKDNEDRTKEEKQKVRNYVLKGNRLFRAINDGARERLLFVIPKSMRKNIVVKFHDLMGHFAVDKTVSKIKELYWFPYMKRYVRHHTSMCFECLVNKVPSVKRQGFLHPIPTGRRPFAIVHLDHLGPFVTSSKTNNELLVMIDNMTRFVRLYPVRDTSSKNVLKSVKSFVEDFGLPNRISDRGSCFTSPEFQRFCDDQRDWDSKIKETERNLNNTVNKTLGKTPFEVLHGYVPRFKDGILRLLADEEHEVWNDPEKLQLVAREKFSKGQEKRKAYYDKKKSGTLLFDKGETVVVRRNPKATGEPTKTQPRYRSPMVVTEILPSDTYRISQLEPSNGRLYATTANVSQLKAWRSWNEDDDDSSEDSDDEPDVQRPKPTVRIPERYGVYMPDR
ncbi:Transposon Tf2-8 polyprotein [Araneus ventricosus]|uniref:RNA-directed DNA polymerase n=1 Tax=Araneus ventricosus TaxID=182803 RepID=A0A4Y2CZK0_ARAVE|nr:Transposon Tf2-8 polyprotein [Araneus ventricosus]